MQIPDTSISESRRLFFNLGSGRQPKIFDDQGTNRTPNNNERRYFGINSEIAK